MCLVYVLTPLKKIYLSHLCQRYRSLLQKSDKELLALLAVGSHFFPFRTESLSPPALMVLRLMPWESKSVPTQYNNLAPVAEMRQGLLALHYVLKNWKSDNCPKNIRNPKNRFTRSNTERSRKKKFIFVILPKGLFVREKLCKTPQIS